MRNPCWRIVFQSRNENMTYNAVVNEMPAFVSSKDIDEKRVEGFANELVLLFSSRNMSQYSESEIIAYYDKYDNMLPGDKIAVVNMLLSAYNTGKFEDVTELYYFTVPMMRVLAHSTAGFVGRQADDIDDLIDGEKYEKAIYMADALYQAGYERAYARLKEATEKYAEAEAKSPQGIKRRIEEKMGIVDAYINELNSLRERELKIKKIIEGIENCTDSVKVNEKQIHNNEKILSQLSLENTGFDIVEVKKELDLLSREYNAQAAYNIIKKKKISKKINETKTILDKLLEEKGLRESNNALFAKNTDLIAEIDKMKSEQMHFDAEFRKEEEILTSRFDSIKDIVEAIISLDIDEDTLCKIMQLPCDILKEIVEDERFINVRAIDIGKRIKLIKDFSNDMAFGDFSWHVVRIYHDKALLLCSKPLYKNIPFNKEYSRYCSLWDNCSLKEFLNEGFLNAFSYEEREKMDGEIFCLTRAEANEYLTKKQLVLGRNWWLGDDPDLYTNYLTDNDEKQYNAYYVGALGEIDYTRIDSRDASGCFADMYVRPAVWVKISSECFDYRWNKMIKEKGCIDLKGKWVPEKAEWMKMSVSIDGVLARMREKENSAQTKETIEIVPIPDVRGI
ncbi:MAG: hypothetical protein IKB50_03065 [Clostridia bacterium]|nr:hypothetical protein [Clostridia bacterium]